MKKLNLLIIFLSVCSYVVAQQNSDLIKKRMMDSIKSVHIDEAALKYPRIRQFSISHEEVGNSNISSKLYGQNFFKGPSSWSATTINLNIPIIERKKNIFVAGFGATQRHFRLGEVTNYNPDYNVSTGNWDLTTLSTSLSYIRRDSLFKRPITYHLSVTGLFNPSFSRQRFIYTGLVSLTLFRNKNSSLMIGAAAIRDPSSPVPVFLVVSYFHKFRSLGVDLMIDLPSRIALRKDLKGKASISAFSELGGNNYFLDMNTSNLPQKSIFTTLSLKSGVLFEYRLSKKAVLSLSGGFQSTLTSKLVGQGDKVSNYFIKNSNGMTPYAQVGFSLLPFWKGLNL
ncbi:MAG: hypothetical protein V4506_08145 [Bacteroidota bacterium]